MGDVESSAVWARKTRLPLIHDYEETGVKADKLSVVMQYRLNPVPAIEVNERHRESLV